MEANKYLLSLLKLPLKIYADFSLHTTVLSKEMYTMLFGVYFDRSVTGVIFAFRMTYFFA